MSGRLFAAGRYATLVAPDRFHHAALRELLDDPVTMQWLEFMRPRPSGWTLEGLEDRYRLHAEREARGEALSLVIVDEESGAVAGSCGFNRIDATAGAADFGIIVAARFWGHPLVAETHLLVLEHGFTALGLSRVTFVTLGTNFRMRGLLEALGLPLVDDVDTELEGLPVPGHVYELRREAWPEVRRRLGERTSRPRRRSP